MNYTLERFKKIFSPKNVQDLIIELNVHSISIDWDQKTFEVDYLDDQANELVDNQSQGYFYKEIKDHYTLSFETEDESDDLRKLIKLAIEFTSIQEPPFFNGPSCVILKLSNEDILRREQQKSFDAGSYSEDEHENFMGYEEDYSDEPDLNEDFRHMDSDDYDDYISQF